MPAQVYQVLSLLVTTEAAVFLARAGIGLSPTAIRALSGTYFNSNPHLAAALCKQEADTRAGLYLLLLGVATGVLSLRPTAQTASPFELLGALVAAVVFYGLATKFSTRRAARTLRAVTGDTADGS
jgi:cobalamin synthase